MFNPALARRAGVLKETRKHNAEWDKCAKSSAYFVDSFCWTLNPDLDPSETRFRLYPFQFEYLDLLREMLMGRFSVHNDKTRQMGDTWAVLGSELWGMLFEPGYTGFNLARKANDVDDGGENSTVDSLFGRVKFMFDRMPSWMQKRAPVRFSYMRITNPANPAAYLTGEGVAPNAARHGSHRFGLWDECAHTQYANTIYSGWKRSVRAGLFLSTPGGKRNLFHRLKKARIEGMRYITHHWHLHPVYGKDAYRDAQGKWRSPWYDKETQGMTDDEIARELDCKYEGSVAALIMKEWDGEAHVVTPDIPYDNNLPLHLWWDFGIGDDTSVGIGQVNRNEAYILRSYSQSGLLAPQHAENIRGILTSIGYSGNYRDIIHHADPSGIARSLTTGTSIIYEYEKIFSKFANGASVKFNTPRYFVEDGIRECRRRLKNNLIFVSVKATEFIDSIEAYQRAVDREGNVKEDAQPLHNWACHIMDAFRYFITSVFGVRGEAVSGEKRGRVSISGGRAREGWKV